MEFVSGAGSQILIFSYDLKNGLSGLIMLRRKVLAVRSRALVKIWNVGKR